MNESKKGEYKEDEHEKLRFKNVCSFMFNSQIYELLLFDSSFFFIFEKGICIKVISIWLKSF